MLGRLARWLRALGYDTAFDPGPDDAELVAWSVAQQRVLLTRDRHLITHLRPPRALLIRADRPLRQLREVADGCGLTHAPALFQRCLVCNRRLRLASAAEARRAPESASAFADPVRCCPGCARVYWPGSHTRRMRAALASALPEWLG